MIAAREMQLEQDINLGPSSTGMRAMRGRVDVTRTLDSIAVEGAAAIVLINSHTQLYGVIGSPVSEALNPALLSGAFRRMRLNAACLAMEATNLPDSVRGIRALRIGGASIVGPFKSEILPLLDELAPEAAAIGAANTLVNARGKLVGHNTEWIGAVRALENTTDLNGKRVLLLGAGGAARAIAFGLKKRGCQVFVFNRSSQKSADIARRFGVHFLLVDMLEDVRAEILVNATSVGSSPMSQETPVGKGLLHEGMIVMDAVCHPCKTRLLRAAEESGCTAINGLEMLAHNAAAQVRIWTGSEPEYAQMIADLDAFTLATR